MPGCVIALDNQLSHQMQHEPHLDRCPHFQNYGILETLGGILKFCKPRKYNSDVGCL